MFRSRPPGLAFLLAVLALAVGCGGGSGGRSPDAGDAADAAAADVAAEAAPDGSAAADAAPDAAPEAGDAGPDGGDAADAAYEAMPTSNCGVVGSLIANCSFEQPPTPASNYQNFTPGQTIGGWTVTGPAALSTINGKYTENGYSFPAHDGAQAIDLTGFASNVAAGVSQSVATTIGTRYELSFWVGNIVDATGPFGTTSTVLAFADGVQVGMVVNTDGAGTKTLAWKGFTASFTATKATTTVELRNGDPSTDNSNILDDVTLVPAK
jgi:hypothetical protein